MKRLPFFFLSLFFLVLAPGVCAEHVECEGPVIAPAGKNFSYIMDAVPDTYGGSSRKNGKMPDTNPPAKMTGESDQFAITHWEIARWGEVTCIIMANNTGQKGEIWMKEGLKIVKPPEGSGFYIDREPPQRDRFRVDLGRYGYPHASWISPEFYVHTVKFNDTDTLYFRILMTNPAPDTKLKNGSPKPSKEAWIDNETRNPICIREEGGIYTFHILPPKPLEIPPEALSVVTNESTAMKPFTSEIQGHAKSGKTK